MKICLKPFVLICCCMWLLLRQASAQDSSSLYSKIVHFPDKLFAKVTDKSADIEGRLTRQTNKYLNSLAKQERKLKKQLAKKDSLAAMRIFDDALEQYAALQTKVGSLQTKSSRLRGTYIPHLDSLQTAFGFLSKTEGLLGNAPQAQGKIKEALSHMDQLQGRFTQAEEVKRFVQQRQQFLKEHLGRYGLAKQLKSFHKQIYYYQAQVEEYKQLFSDPSRLEAKAVELLTQSAPFRDFFSQNSQLASLFRLPGSSRAITAQAGMQTRESVTRELVQRFGSEAQMQQVIGQQVQNARAQLGGLKDKITKLGGSGSNAQMPDFKPNNQKTKSFLKRIELGSNLQTVKANRFFPSTTDIGLSVGYKINDKSIAGVGGSYRMGWGRDLRHARITHQGAGLRSFVDFKLKGSFWLSGGAEMNYRNGFGSFDILKDYSAWQSSALLGISKKYQVSRKLKGNMQLLYDFLYRQQVPRTQPVVFRLGYNFK